MNASQRIKSCILLILILLTAQACSQATPATNELTPIRIAYELGVDFGKIPSLLAWERMRDYGYEVIPKFYPDSPTALQALARGDADVGAGDPTAVINANAAGQSLKVFAVQNGIQYALITPVSITSPEQLEGKRVAYHSPSSMTKALAFLAAERYGFTPEWMVMQGSEVRAEALLSGQIDATVIDYENTINVEMLRPNEYHVLISFVSDFPGLLANSFFATSDYIDKNPDAVQALCESLILTYRRVNSDPTYLFDQTPVFLPELGAEPEKLQAMVDLYVQYQVWGSNGGFTQDAAERTIDLYVETGDLTEAPPFDSWADIGPMNKALDKLGRE